MAEKLKQVTISTDGACIGNPGPGGCAFICYAAWSSKVHPVSSANAAPAAAISTVDSSNPYTFFENPCTFLRNPYTFLQEIHALF